MIIQALCTLVFGTITLLLDLIPTISFPQGFVAVLDDIRFLIAGANYFIPIPTVLMCLTAIFVVDNVKFLMSIFNWIISKIPSIN